VERDVNCQLELESLAGSEVMDGPSCGHLHPLLCGSVWKVRTQDPEKLDEEVKSLVTAWRLLEKRREHRQLLPSPSPSLYQHATWHTVKD